MNKLEEILNYASNLDLDYSEVFYEDNIINTYIMNDSKLDDINTNRVNGIGIRLVKNSQVYYGYTNNINSYKEIIDNLSVNFQKCNPKKIKLTKKKLLKIVSVKKEYSDTDKKNILLKVDEIARKNAKVSQVEAKIYESRQSVKIANSLGTYVEDIRPLTRLIVTIVAKEKDKVAKSYQTFGISGGYELFDDLDIEKEVNELTESAVTKLDALPSPGGDMPVIIGPGFGAVIFHEACGHAMEATTVARNISVLSNKLNEKIASDKVTIIDDGTIKSLWGSVNVDDEGNYPNKNLLIENGYLRNYLIDYVNSKKMKMAYTGSGRRQNYKYAPTSRMNNTYLLKGTDKIEDMIKSIKYGLYAKQMGGGSVNPITGDFNFSVEEAFLIEDGKITKPVKGASLIGNTLDILKNVEMVSDNLEYGTGWCGSESGSIPVITGEPTIKVSKILVGGTNE